MFYLHVAKTYSTILSFTDGKLASTVQNFYLKVYKEKVFYEEYGSKREDDVLLV